MFCSQKAGRRHYALDHNTVVLIYDCEVYGNKYETRTSLQRHLGKHHSSCRTAKKDADVLPPKKMKSNGNTAIQGTVLQGSPVPVPKTTADTPTSDHSQSSSSTLTNNPRPNFLQSAADINTDAIVNVLTDPVVRDSFNLS